MEIRCPNCGYSRNVDAHSIDPDVTVATCPKCSTKFPFRSVDEKMPEFSLEAPDSASGQNDAKRHPDAREAGDQEVQSEQRAVRPEDLYPPSVHNGMNDDNAAQDDESRPAERLTMVYSDGTPLDETVAGMPKDVPWADVKELGFFPAMKATIQGVLRRPSLFFEVMDKKGKFTIPFSFFILVSLVSVIAETVWQSTVGNPFFPEEAAGALTLDDLFTVVFISPLILIVYLVITGAVLHGALRLTGGGSRGMGVTLRVLCYAAAADLFSLVPFVGPLIGGIWKLVVVLIGLKTAHNTTYTRVILPVALLVLGLVSFVFYSLKSQGIV
ncbi:MAG: zinc-ribbon domain-containing protein [Desulfovibrionales bacterium]|nr:zinc-ribbon domain-containing protein [Desulfovibrionales bacterium]